MDEFDLLPKMASAMNRMVLDKTYKIYNNGSILLDPNLGLLERFDAKHHLHNGLYLYNQEGREDVVLVNKDMDLADAYDMYSEDMDTMCEIFDSKVDDITNYETIMYIFVNKDVKMGRGKIAAQIAHLSAAIVERCINEDYDQYAYWDDSFRKCVVCGATAKQLEELKKMEHSEFVLDAGRTQVKPGCLTAVGFYPMMVKDLPDNFKAYKLLD